MNDYEKVIHALIDPLVEHKDSIMIKELPGSTERDITILIVAEDADTARLIGKKGSVANALREAISIKGKADDSNIRIHLKFESFGEDDAN
ncbi:MAG: KH domain-containing protein [Bacilli bacterium]|nr:KH domain-containing protein [Bacilli bacterium]